jgi:hypothetical protein
LESDIWNSPTLSFNKLHDSPSDGPKPKPRSHHKAKPGSRELPGLAEGFQFIYAVPYLALGSQHQHWELSDLESKELAQAFLKAVGSSDNKNFARLLKTLEKYLPVFMLLSCVYVITAPRVRETIKVLDEKAGRNQGRVLHPVDGTFGPSAYPGTDETVSASADQQQDQKPN